MKRFACGMKNKTTAVTRLLLTISVGLFSYSPTAMAVTYGCGSVSTTNRAMCSPSASTPKGEDCTITHDGSILQQRELLLPEQPYHAITMGRRERAVWMLLL